MFGEITPDRSLPERGKNSGSRNFGARLPICESLRITMRHFNYEFFVWKSF
jgi:hypothetical protein